MGIGTELRVAFESGLLVDMAIVDSDEFKLLKSNKVFCEKILNRGTINIKNLERKEEHNYYLVKENSIPLEYELNRKIDEFWIDMANIYKYLSRNDIFSAKYAFDRRITKILIYILEEYSKTINPSIDVMFNGRYMDRWLDDQSIKQIYNINSSTNKSKMLNCIQSAIELFEDRINKIFKYYGYNIENDKNIIINFIKNRIYNLCILTYTLNTILKYNNGDNYNKINKILLKKIKEQYYNKQKLSFVIPAFPGKSPNKNSSFSYLPDYTENIAIDTITNFINEINNVYPFKSEIIIIHDGHFFTNIGITRNEKELNEYINCLKSKFPRYIKSMTIYELMGERKLEIAYKKFYEKYVENTNDNIYNIYLSKEILFTKYEFYDKIISTDSMSKNQLQMKSKQIAMSSLEIKKGINKMIKNLFPDSIRLSVHYQDSSSEKMGLKLLPNAINNGTPWFYVAYRTSTEKIILGKKNWQFESKKLINSNKGKYYLIDDEDFNRFKNGEVNKNILNERELNR